MRADRRAGADRVGTIRVRGEDIASPTPSGDARSGVCYFPSDRVAEGLALARPVRENVSMAALDLPAFSRHRILQRRRRAAHRARASSTSCRCARRSIERAVAHFSGGNRQKILLARGLTRDISVYLFDEPTVGIDVGAKVEIYELMKSLLATGVAIVLVSSDLPEVLHLSHRLYVMHRSRMVAELTWRRHQRAGRAFTFLPRATCRTARRTMPRKRSGINHSAMSA